jgi:hypothetical protein
VARRCHSNLLRLRHQGHTALLLGAPAHTPAVASGLIFFLALPGGDAGSRLSPADMVRTSPAQRARHLLPLLSHTDEPRRKSDRSMQWQRACWLLNVLRLATQV